MASSLTCAIFLMRDIHAAGPTNVMRMMELGGHEGPEGDRSYEELCRWVKGCVWDCWKDNLA